MIAWNGTAVWQHQMDAQIITDTSSWAWVALCENQKGQGFWNKRLSHKSFNYRELMAILLALHSFKDNIQNLSVQILTDNVSAVAYVNLKEALHHS